MAGLKCEPGCTCSRHKVSDERKAKLAAPRKKCEPGCTCSRHKRVMSAEHKANIAAANKARQGESRRCPEGCTCNRHQGRYFGGSKKGRKLSEQAKINISEAAGSRTYSEGQREKLSDAMKAHRVDEAWEARRKKSLREALLGTECPQDCTCGKHHPSSLSLPQHKGNDGTRGYVYVIEYSTGIIKVGRTTSPRQRIRAQAYVASKLGVEPVSVWLSVHHENYKANEVSLLAALGSPMRGSEYFDVKFEVAVKHAEALVEGSAVGVSSQPVIGPTS